MSKKSTTKKPAKKRTLDRLPLNDRVKALMPVARKLLADGMDDARVEWSEDIPYDEPRGLSDRQIGELVACIEVAYATGIALGLMLRPEAFGTDGAR